MTQEILKIRSSIRPQLLRSALLQGTVAGALGSVLLLFSGIFLSQEVLKTWGMLIFFFSLGLIAWGLIPYRRLKQLETTPHEIVIVDDKQFLFCWKREPVFAVPFAKIAKVTFISSGDVYGIGIWLTDPALSVYNHFDLETFRQKSLKKYGCDLFLPYFSERSMKVIVPTE